MHYYDLSVWLHCGYNVECKFMTMVLSTLLQVVHVYASAYILECQDHDLNSEYIMQFQVEDYDRY